MKIIVDGFGGDNAPLAVLEGCRMAADEYGVEIILTGDEKKLRACAEEHRISLAGMELVHTLSVIPVDAHPQDIMTEYADSSMAEAMRLLSAGKGDAVVCAGSTGAMVVSASLMVRRIKGVKRATLAPIIPSESGCYILMDAGANVECRPEMLLQFGVMGSAYMEKIMGIKQPRVAVVNIGAEETKGRELELGAHALFRQSGILNFTGNIEPRYIPRGDADVVITDGFTGNVVLKLTEGLGKMIGNALKDIFMDGFAGKIARLLVLKKVKAFKKKMDYTEYGGAPLLGISKPVIKAHGSSNGNAFKNAIRQARDFAERDVIGQITDSLAKIKEQNTQTKAE